MLWIKEAEMVDSVDDLNSSRSTKGTPGPDFELLDARIASAMNKIIQTTRFKKKVSLEEMKGHKEDQFRGRQIAYLIYDYFRVTGANDSVENNADLFTVGLRNDDIQEFDSKWDGILLSMTKIPSDDILEGLYKLRIRESEKLKTVLELYSMEIHQKKAGPDYHRLTTMVKKKVPSKIFEIRILATEMEIMRETPWSRIRRQNSVDRILGDCWQWKLTGSVRKETIAVSVTISISVEKLHHQIRLRILSWSRMSENHREPEVPEVRAPVVECFDGLARITSKELAPIHSVKNGTLQNACSTRPRVVVGLGRSAHSHIVRLMNSRQKGLRRMMTKVLWLCWKLHDNWAADVKIWSRWSLHRFCGRAQTYGNKSDVFNSHNPSYVMLTFETKIHRLEWFVQVILISATTQCSKIWGSVTRRDRVARARCPRSSVEAGQKCVKIKGAPKSSILLTFGKLVPACIKS